MSATPNGEHPLDNPTWAALTNTHTSVAVANGNAAAYDRQVSVFWGVKGPDSEGKWDADVWQDVEGLLHKVAGDKAAAATFLTGPDQPPAGWETLLDIECVQMVGPESESDWPDGPHPPNLDGLRIVELGAADSADMAELANATNPGPWRPRTFELGGYHGFRSTARAAGSGKTERGALVAMAGQRLRPPGWTEISAVCTDEEHRGQGLASRLVLDVAFHARERGSRALLHASASNTAAIRVYERLGFTLRRRTTFGVVRTPAA